MSTSTGAIIPITMPKFGLAMTEGKIASWAKPEGAAVAVGDELADIETTKITNAYESPVAGVLRRHVAPEQEDLPVGALIAVVADPSVPEVEIDAFVTRFQAEFVTRQSVEATQGAPAPATIEAGGHSLRYLELGQAHEGRPIVLIHGFGGDLNNWLFTQPALAGQVRVIALDLPGHGGSSKQVGAGDLAALSGALLAFLAAKDIPRAHLVGHSLGGAVALRTALDKPAHVASLTLIAPAGLGTEIDGAFPADFISAGRRKQLQPVLQKLFADKSLVSHDMVEDLLRFKRLDGAKEALSAIAEANFGGGRQQEILAGRLPELGDLPVQVIWGELDEIIPASQARSLPGSVRVQVLPGAGHMPHMEKSAEVNRMILGLALG
ncbi:Dihydrolipoyllysine-residue acetyltransferase component of acetoin cleaving system [Rhodovastum atsumiense]|uniref:Acetoin dehydrogenase dihydrolipoyllysine-residue acetyltransferase subunit n=1 Tax=Rhodovastum atsumiense TaxID=504468 RepID=A0A5M6IS90_9PROT|nr:acetoin dehydrogenase dihydrolipoyllysine-residue acetyltransferase subunit [Rhodovastum atsumiense]KAA5610438.1 acetoin dehydrogenase dihydrolipoyllysine-residue acetyltransferase subunit [Rhodovastum atsumiense]CAH2600421.1 Dihydrolipoyllysine-residue acetyltransferase component of acetoin cleaving system [Rhodovastum atsumiense]